MTIQHHPISAWSNGRALLFFVPLRRIKFYATRMAQLKIYSDIVSQEEKDGLKIWFGDYIDTGVTFTDIDEFVAQMAEDDNAIDIYINCRGGDVQNGWAIYDKLRATGKEITTIVEGQASSMASVILLAAPKERRKAQPHATVLIHNPYIPYAEGQMDANKLREMADDMETESNKILDLYVERTGTDRDTLKKLMDAETRMTAEQALEYGFISTIIAPASAKAAGTKSKTMSLIEKIKALIAEGEGSADPVAMELTTVTGGTLTIEREEGEPQVGDKASPDGTHEMPDGKTIIVTDGVITEIQEPAAGDDDEVAKLTQKVADLTAENEDLKAQLEASKAQAKTAEDNRILNAVRIAGGLEKLTAASSHGAPAGRQYQGRAGGQEPAKPNAMQQRTCEMLAKRKK